MTRKEISALERRVAGLKRRYAAGVVLIVPSESGYDPIYSAYNRRHEIREESHHATLTEAETAHNRFLQEHPAARGEIPALIVIDV